MIHLDEDEVETADEDVTDMSDRQRNNFEIRRSVWEKEICQDGERMLQDMITRALRSRFGYVICDDRRAIVRLLGERISSDNNAQWHDQMEALSRSPMTEENRAWRLAMLNQLAIQTLPKVMAYLFGDLGKILSMRVE